jgi:hypothetical protein
MAGPLAHAAAAFEPSAKAFRPAVVLRCAVLATAALASIAVWAPAAHAAGCGKTYSYAGVASQRTGGGVRATLTVLATPDVPWGHVAGWIGVGGVGRGPSDSSEWVQVGYSGFFGGESHLYFEVARPGGQPTYTDVKTVRVGDATRVAVAEMRGRHDWWRVRVNGLAVSKPIHLPGSHGRWEPIATAESWNAGKGTCNGFAYRFSRLAVASRPNAGWRTLRIGDSFQDPPYRVVPTAGGFIARGGT